MTENGTTLRSAVHEGSCVREYWHGDSVELSVVLSVYGLVGLTGNALILTVYSRQRAALPHSTIIFLLALVDFLVCGVIVPYTIVYERRLVTSDVICRGLEVLRHTLVIASNVMLMVIAVQRYLSVFHPWKVRATKTNRSAILAAFLGCAIMGMPSAAIFMVSSKRVEASNDSLTSTYTSTTITTTTTSSTTGTTATIVLETTKSGTVVTGSVSTANSSSKSFLTEMTSCSEHAYCQYSTSLLGERWTLAYQVFLAFQFILCVMVIATLYVKVYKQIWTRAKRRQRVGPLKIVHPPSCPAPSPASPLPGGLALVTTGACRSEIVNSEPCHSGGGTATAANKTDDPLKTEGRKNIVLGNTQVIVTIHEPVIALTSTTTNAKTTAMKGFNVNSRHGNNIINNSTNTTGVCNNNNNNNSTNTTGVCNNNNNNNSNSRLPRDIDHQGKRAGSMLFVCSLIHLLVWLPFWVDVFRPGSHLMFRYTFLLAHVTNPLVYGVMNPKVRQEVRRLLLCQQPLT